MPQDRESGARARKWGYTMGQKVSDYIGATLLEPGQSNEAIWNGRNILIKAAHYGVPQIGATPATLDRIDAIIAVLEDPDGEFSLYEIAPAWFKKEMKPSLSPKASHVMMRQCTSVRKEGKLISRMDNPFK